VDASAWVALFDARDGHHEEASMYYRLLIEDLDEPIVTSNWTVYEALSVVKNHAGHDSMYELRRSLSQRVGITVIRVSEQAEQEAVSLFIDPAYRNRRWSVVDCANVVIASESGCQDFLAFNPRDFPELCGYYGIHEVP
jgi:predicted nucleic acid-binding protein